LAKGLTPENPGWLKVSRTNKVPSALHLLNPIIMGSRDQNLDSCKTETGLEFQLLNTLYSVYLLANGVPEFDVKSITADLKAEHRSNLHHLCSEFDEFLRIHPIGDRVSFNEFVFGKIQSEVLLKISSSAGPNASNAMESAIADAHALRQSDV